MVIWKKSSRLIPTQSITSKKIDYTVMLTALRSAKLTSNPEGRVGLDFSLHKKKAASKVRGLYLLRA